MARSALDRRACKKRWRHGLHYLSRKVYRALPPENVRAVGGRWRHERDSHAVPLWLEEPLNDPRIYALLQDAEDVDSGASRSRVSASTCTFCIRIRHLASALAPESVPTSASALVLAPSMTSNTRQLVAIQQQLGEKAKETKQNDGRPLTDSLSKNENHQGTNQDQLEETLLLRQLLTRMIKIPSDLDQDKNEKTETVTIATDSEAPPCLATQESCVLRIEEGCAAGTCMPTSTPNVLEALLPGFHFNGTNMAVNIYQGAVSVMPPAAMFSMPPAQPPMFAERPSVKVDVGIVVANGTTEETNGRRRIKLICKVSMITRIDIFKNAFYLVLFTL